MMGASVTLTLSPELLSPDFLFKHYHIIGSGQNDREYLYEALYYVAKSKVRVMTEIFPLEHIIFL
jgi:D-arabinose 1-dehydrogenase-like Zn-dependent alcohol dehydrogenase